MRAVARIAIAAMALAWVAPGERPVVAQEWPSKPVVLILPAPPGGAIDTSARIIQDAVSEAIGRRIIIENRPGGAFTIAVQALKSSQPDGYTFGSVGPAFVLNPTLLKKVNYDPIEDFVPIAFMWQAPSVIMVHPSQPYRTLKELLDTAKSKPGAVTYASSGVGTSMHIAGELLKLSANVDIPHIPYRGAGPALVDAIAGQFPMSISNIASAAPLVQEGKLRALAISGAVRAPLFPDVPTVRESGFPDFVVTEWMGVVAPRNTPDAIVRKMNEAIRAAFRRPEVRARYGQIGLENVEMSPQEMGRFIEAERVKFSTVIKKANITLD